MISIARLVAAASIVFAMATPAMSQGASRAAPDAGPARGADRDKGAKQGERKDQDKSGADGDNNDAPRADPGGCPYIKRKLELIV